MSRALSRIRIAAALAAGAIAVGGCSSANNATQASNQSEPHYKTMYGLSSEGTTTDLYTELFGPRQPSPAPAPAVAAAQPAQPVIAPPPAPQPASVANAERPGQKNQATASRTRQPTSIQPAPQPAPVQVAQQPAPPPAPEEPDVPTAYGITAKGPTTDLYTAIFGPRRSDGQ